MDSDVHPRRLSYDEMLVLRLIQAVLGSRHSIADVVVTAGADACIAVRDATDAAGTVLNLTALGGWYRSGAMTLEGLRRWVAGQPSASAIE